MKSLREFFSKVVVFTSFGLGLMLAHSALAGGEVQNGGSSIEIKGVPQIADIYVDPLKFKPFSPMDRPGVINYINKFKAIFDQMGIQLIRIENKKILKFFDTATTSEIPNGFREVTTLPSNCTFISPSSLILSGVIKNAACTIGKARYFLTETLQWDDLQLSLVYVHEALHIWAPFADLHRKAQFVAGLYYIVTEGLGERSQHTSEQDLLSYELSKEAMSILADYSSVIYELGGNIKPEISQDLFAEPALPLQIHFSKNGGMVVGNCGPLPQLNITKGSSVRCVVYQGGFRENQIKDLSPQTVESWVNNFVIIGNNIWIHKSALSFRYNVRPNELRNQGVEKQNHQMLVGNDIVIQNVNWNSSFCAVATQSGSPFKNPPLLLSNELQNYGKYRFRPIEHCEHYGWFTPAKIHGNNILIDESFVGEIVGQNIEIVGSSSTRVAGSNVSIKNSATSQVVGKNITILDSYGVSAFQSPSGEETLTDKTGAGRKIEVINQELIEVRGSNLSITSDLANLARRQKRGVLSASAANSWVYIYGENLTMKNSSFELPSAYKKTDECRFCSIGIYGNNVTVSNMQIVRGKTIDLPLGNSSKNKMSQIINEASKNANRRHGVNIDLNKIGNGKAAPSTLIKITLDYYRKAATGLFGRNLNLSDEDERVENVGYFRSEP
jgi:hypothetical protein